MKFSLIENEGVKVITVLVNGDLMTATQEHPNFEQIVDAAMNDTTEGLADLFDLSVRVARQFAQLADSERISVSGGTVFLDGDPVNNALTDQILAFLEEGEDFGPLVKFYDRLLANPQEHSREQLYRWLQAHRFTIDEEGYIIGYKGVGVDYYSSNSGHAIVNGVEVNGKVLNEPGSIIEMPRSEVQHDPSVACHAGLHVGTWSYASTFNRRTVLVQVDPRDVVSVPTDHDDNKMRVCRYVILEDVDAPLGSLYQKAEDEVDYDYDLEDDDLCNCGCQDEDEYDDEPVLLANPNRVVASPSRPTADNFLRQKRDNNGRFIKS